MTKKKEIINAAEKKFVGKMHPITKKYLEQLYGMTRIFASCDAFGNYTDTEDCFCIYPNNKDQIGQITNLLAMVGVQKIKEITVKAPKTETVILLPYLASNIGFQRIAVEMIAKEFKDMAHKNNDLMFSSIKQMYAAEQGKNR